MRKAHAAQRALSTEGSILLEVLVALVVLGVLVGPMVTAVHSAVSGAAAARLQMSGARHVPSESSSGRAWGWGPRIADATWRLGPVLQIKVQPVDGAVPVVGIWINGWFTGEQSPEPDGLLSVDSDLLSDRAGQELVVRERMPGEPWGPAWRSTVPDADGSVPGAMAAEGAESGEGAPGAVISLAHAPGLASPALVASWTEAPVASLALGVPLFLAPATTGRCELSLCGGTQSWWMESERVLDVYF
ncbi:MAG: hypothetical protein A2133_11945 [Actinobacteria bacterium RBG_16_64_13]|nr:MAG: hypothetical protein A2133_11945 [Actinobacteria bacterium RBG_16_64_13]